jgi:EAL domain-containing protein (putative c-di-GMP-specific phosphodiesterase class I)
MSGFSTVMWRSIDQYKKIMDQSLRSEKQPGGLAMTTARIKDKPLADIINITNTINTNVDHILQAVRTHLGMDVAFISEFKDHDRVFRYVNAENDQAPITVGDRLPLDQGYCQRILLGQLPQLMPDTADVPAALALPETTAVPVGAHIGVPIHLSNGDLYGTFCCFSARPDRSLNQRDLSMMMVLAELIGRQLDTEMKEVTRREEVITRLHGAMKNGQPEMVYQPIFTLPNRDIVGVECLSRFQMMPYRTPDIWFAEAASAGLWVPFERQAICTALAELAQVPGDFYISLNTSPQTVLSGELVGILELMAPERLVLEITEHHYIDNYAELLTALAPLRTRGVRIAIDDAGAGYASMRHILNIRPDLIKLDNSLSANINDDPMRCALTRALIEFARSTGSTMIAEGVETIDELETLYALGVRCMQGYHLSRPLPLSGLSELLSQHNTYCVY